jgi:hypothetical protein
MAAVHWGLAMASAGLLAAQSPTAPLGDAAPQGVGYGPPNVVELSDLDFAPETHHRRMVITLGTIDPVPLAGYHALADGPARTLLIPADGVPSTEITGRAGLRVQVRGVVRRIRPKEYVMGKDLDLIEDPSLPVLPAPAPGLPRTTITVMSLTDREPLPPRQGTPPEASVHDIVEDPAQYAGKKITLRGQFRGHNLFGDLPASSGRAPGDFVLKDGQAAFWVVGKAPRGKGFSLDPSYKGDAIRWLGVTGKAEVVNGVLYLRASRVVLTTPPPEGQTADR